jgi:hypothetical protein
MRKKTRISLVSALAVLVLAVAGWQYFKYRLAHRKIAQAVAAKTKGLYLLHYDDLRFDEVAGRLHVRNIDIRPDTAVFEQMRRENRDPHVLLQIRIDSLDISGVKTPKALFGKEIVGGRLDVVGARIRVMVHRLQKDSAVYNPAPDLAQQLLGSLLKIAVDSLQIRDASVLVGGPDSSDVYFRGDKVSLGLYHLLIDSNASKDSSTILFSRGLSLGCKALELPSRNRRYLFGIDSLRFTSTDNTLRVGELRISPRLSEADFAASYPMQRDRYDFWLKDIALRHIDRKALWRKTIRADSLVIGESSFKVYRDLSRPPDTTSKVGKYPQQLLMHLPLPVSISRIIFSHSFIEYKEKNGRSHSAGKVQFYAVRARIENVTNRRADYGKEHRCVLDFHARFLDKAAIDARLVLFLGHPRGLFTLEGDLGSIDASALNPLTEPMALARLDRGNIKLLQFAIRGTDSAAEGRVSFAYEGLKVSMLKKDSTQAAYHKKGLVSLFANIVLKNSSPAEGPEPKEVHFQRILNKSIFNLMWKTLFMGVKKSAGIK